MSAAGCTELRVCEETGRAPVAGAVGSALVPDQNGLCPTHWVDGCLVWLPPGEAIAAVARSYVGTPYRHQGRGRLEGLDCGGLVYAVGFDLGLLTPAVDLSGYCRLPDGKTMAAHMRRHFQKVDVPLVGDIVLVRPADYLRWPSHMGIVTKRADGEDGMVHAFNALGRGRAGGRDGVVESYLRGWRQRVIAAFRYPGV